MQGVMFAISFRWYARQLRVPVDYAAAAPVDVRRCALDVGADRSVDKAVTGSHPTQSKTATDRPVTGSKATPGRGLWPWSRPRQAIALAVEWPE